MVEGLWTVEFRGSMGNSGTGVVILRDGKIGGGDAGYYDSVSDLLNLTAV